MDIAPDSRWRVCTGLAWQVVDGSGVVIDPKERLAVGLNPVASFIWEHLSDGTVREVSQDLCTAFEVEPARALADVRSFLEHCRAHSLIETVNEDGAAP